jgi:hypothetical protein
VGTEPVIAFEKSISKTSIGCQWLGRVVTGAEAGRPVLVRQLESSLLEPKERDALFQSAKAYAKIRHPAFLKQLTLVEQNASLLTLSEHLVGIRLLELMARAFRGAAQIPATVAVRIVLDAARATATAHRLSTEAGLFPSERLFLTEGIHVASFGGTLLTEVGTLATLARCEAISRQAEVTAQLSPEEVANGSLTRGSPEVFSLGVLLWECLANQWLFSRDDERKTRDELLRLPIPSLDRVERFGLPVPVPLVELVTTATERRPERRFDNLGSFVAALEQLPSHFVGTEHQVAETLRKLASDALSRHAPDESHMAASGTFSEVPPSRLSTHPPPMGPADFEPPTFAQRRLVPGFRPIDEESGAQRRHPPTTAPAAPPKQALPSLPPLPEPATPSLIGTASSATAAPECAPGPESRQRIYRWLLALSGGGVVLALLVGVWLGQGRRNPATANHEATTRVVQPAPEPVSSTVLSPPGTTAALPAGSSAPSSPNVVTPNRPKNKLRDERTPSAETPPQKSTTNSAYRPRQVAPYRPKGI